MRLCPVYFLFTIYGFRCHFTQQYTSYVRRYVRHHHHELQALQFYSLRMLYIFFCFCPQNWNTGRLKQGDDDVLPNIEHCTFFTSFTRVNKVGEEKSSTCVKRKLHPREEKKEFMRRGRPRLLDYYSFFSYVSIFIQLSFKLNYFFSSVCIIYVDCIVVMCLCPFLHCYATTVQFLTSSHHIYLTKGFFAAGESCWEAVCYILCFSVYFSIALLGLSSVSPRIS